MCSKQNCKCISKRFWYDNKNKWIKNIKKHTSRECKYIFDGKKCNSNKKWNNDKCWCKFKHPRKTSCVQKDLYFGILLHVLEKMVNI